MEEDYNDKIEKMNLLLDNNTELEAYLKFKTNELKDLKYESSNISKLDNLSPFFLKIFRDFNFYREEIGKRDELIYTLNNKI